MFSKIKAIKDLRSQAKQLEKMMEGIVATGTAQGLLIRMNGKQEVLEVQVPESMNRSAIGPALQKALKEVLSSLQSQVQKAIKDMGGLPDMSALMGKE